MPISAKNKIAFKFINLVGALSICIFSITGCAIIPSTYSIDPPYTPDKLSAIELSAKAESICKESRKPDINVPPNPFTSDGCSMFPDGNWRECCITHDFAYWCGGSRKARSKADNELEQCVSDQGHPILGWLMNHLGVQMGGHPLWPTSFRWGYGWAWPYEYDDEK